MRKNNYSSHDGNGDPDIGAIHQQWWVDPGDLPGDGSAEAGIHEDRLLPGLPGADLRK